MQAIGLVTDVGYFLERVAAELLGSPSQPPAPRHPRHP
jgi:hypothetical protein